MNIMIMMLLNAGWAGAVVMWLKDAGGLRHIMQALPACLWREGNKPEAISEMSDHDFVLHLVMRSRLPMWLIQHITCPYCLLASASLCGMIMLRAPLSLESVVVWGASAFLAATLANR